MLTHHLNIFDMKKWVKLSIGAIITFTVLLFFFAKLPELGVVLTLLYLGFIACTALFVIGLISLVKFLSD